MTRPSMLYLVLAGLVVTVCAEFNDTIDEGRLVVATPVASVDTYKFIVSIFDTASTKTDNTGPYCAGVVVHKSWVLAQSTVHEAADISTLRVYSGTLKGDNSDNTAKIKRIRSKVTYTEPDFYAAVDKVFLYKVCPSFADTEIAVIVTAPATLTPGVTDYTYLNFLPTLSQGTKKVGENCECDTYATSLTDYNTNYVPFTFCGAEDAVNHLDPTDKNGAIALLGTNVVGLSLAIGKGGELFIDIAEYKIWINKIVTA